MAQMAVSPLVLQPEPVLLWASTMNHAIYDFTYMIQSVSTVSKLSIIRGRYCGLHLESARWRSIWIKLFARHADET
jgi:hypothetical protein